jgi:hypothetical protein
MKIKKCEFFSQHFTSKLINKVILEKGPEFSCIDCTKTISVRFGFFASGRLSSLFGHQDFALCKGYVLAAQDKIFKKQKSFKNIDFCFHDKKTLHFAKNSFAPKWKRFTNDFTQLEVCESTVDKRKEVSHETKKTFENVENSIFCKSFQTKWRDKKFLHFV